MYFRIKDEKLEEALKMTNRNNTNGLPKLTDGCMDPRHTELLVKTLLEMEIDDQIMVKNLEEYGIKLESIFNDEGKEVYKMVDDEAIYDKLVKCSLYIIPDDDNRIAMAPDELPFLIYSNDYVVLSALPTVIPDLIRKGLAEMKLDDYDDEARAKISEGTKEEVAFKLLYYQLDDDNPDVLSDLACSYETGCGVKKSLYKAKTYYEAAITFGSDQARTNLAKMYVRGEGVNRSINRAVCLLTEAALCHNLDGINTLVLMYSIDKFHIKNEYLAKSIATIGSSLGSDVCSEYMARLYYKGLLVEKDIDGAIFYVDRMSDVNPRKKYWQGIIYFSNPTDEVSQDDALDLIAEASGEGCSEAMELLNELQK